MYKVVHGMVPDYISKQIGKNQSSRYSLRSVSDENLFLPRPNTNFLKRSFHYSAVKIWNELPLTLRNCANLDTFRTKSFEYYLNA